MKRLVSNMSGAGIIYGQKWQNIDSESDDLLNSVQLSSMKAITPHGDDENKIPKEKRVGIGMNGEAMYRAALQGDWLAAEVVLERDPNLAFDYVTEEGDRALLVAAAMKKKYFVEKLVERMSDKELALTDGHGYTACCYAAMSGELEIARLIIGKNRKLVTTHDEKNVTPLYKAALRGDKKMLSYLLKFTQDEDLSKQEWFDLLLVTIRGQMYGVGMEIMAKNGSIATMMNEEGTALHLLARQERSNANSHSKLRSLLDILFLNVTSDWDCGKGPAEYGELPEKLWSEMQKLDKARVLEMIRKPRLLLHDAAKAGKVELLTMLTRTYPQLIWDTDSNGYTIFHIAVLYRQPEVFKLIYQVEAMLGFRTLLPDQNGNTFLHLAAKLAPLSKKKLPPVIQMQNELQYFKKAEEIVPPSCAMMRNNDGVTPRELFSKEHKSLLKESEIWMRNTADSCMLIATILVTVVFAAGFTMPGGYNDEGKDKGKPILGAKIWFKVFLIFEVASLVGSVASIFMFRSIMASRFAEEDFLSKLPMQQMLGYLALVLSLVGAFSAFMIAISLIELRMGAWVWVAYVVFSLFGLIWLFSEFGALYRGHKLNNSMISRRHNLFDKMPTPNQNNLTRSFWLTCKGYATRITKKVRSTTK